MAGPGLYANIHAKRKRGGKMRKKGEKGAPKPSDFKRAKKNSEEKIMTKLCPRGKAAAKRKFKVYPSAYANAYASKICAGKIKDPSGVKRKDFKGRKPAMGGGSMNTRIGLKHGSYEQVPPSKGFSKYVTKQEQKKIDAENKEANEKSKKPTTIDRQGEQARRKAKKQSPVILLNTSQSEIKKLFNKDGRVERRGGGLMEATARLQRQGLKGGGICKKGMNRKAIGKIHNVMAKNGLDKWFAQKWVDIGSKKKDGSFSKCGRSKQKADSKRKYPKCVPLAKARGMSEGQRRSAVKRKRAVAQGVGGKPTNVKTFAKRKKASMGGPIGAVNMTRMRFL